MDVAVDQEYVDATLRALLAGSLRPFNVADGAMKISRMCFREYEDRLDYWLENGVDRSELQSIFLRNFKKALLDNKYFSAFKGMALYIAPEEYATDAESLRGQKLPEFLDDMIGMVLFQTFTWLEVKGVRRR